MNKVIVVTDSTCDLLPSMLKENDIRVVPLNVVFNDIESYKDGVDINSDELYLKVEKLNTLPKSSAPSPKDFILAFEPIIKEGCDIVYLGIGSGFSSTLQAAAIASKEFPEGRIALVDSKNLSSGIGLLVLKAVKFAKMGNDVNTIKTKLEKLVPKVRSQFCIDTFEYLHKGGRCSGVAALFGTMFKIKPIIRVVNNQMIVAEKPRGKKMALDAMIKDILSHDFKIDKDYVMITHSMADEDVPYIKERLSAELKVDNIVETFAGSVISTHCGKGTIGILYIVD